MYSMYKIIATKYKPNPKMALYLDRAETFTWKGFLLAVITFYVWMALVFVSAGVGPDPIINTYPILPLSIMSFVFVHNTINMQVAHVSH